MYILYNSKMSKGSVILLQKNIDFIFIRIFIVVQCIDMTFIFIPFYEI